MKYKLKTSPKTKWLHKCEGFYDECPATNATYNEQNTAYIDDRRNYRWLCPLCQKESDWSLEMDWQEYYWNFYN